MPARLPNWRSCGLSDVIVSIKRAKGDVVKIKNAEEFEAVRAKTSPGEDISLGIRPRWHRPQTLVAKLTRRPLEVTRPEIDNIHMRNGTVPPGFVDPPSFLLSMATLGGEPLSGNGAKVMEDWLEKGNWTVAAHDQKSVTFERPIPAQNLKLIKRYTLEPVPPGSRSDENYPGYNLRLDVEIQNTGDAPLKEVAYRLDGPTGMPLEGWWYAHKISQRWFSGAGLRDVVVRFQGRAEHANRLRGDRPGQGRADGPRKAAGLHGGVDGQYFSAVMIPVRKSLEEDWFDTTEAIVVGPKPEPRTPVRFTNVTCRVTRMPVDLAAGESQTRFISRLHRPEAARFAGTVPSRQRSQLFAQGPDVLRLASSAPWPTACSAFCTSSTASSAITASRSSCSRCWCAAAMFPDQLQANAEHGPHAGAQAGDGSHQRKIQDRHAEEVAGDAGAVSQAQHQSARRLLAGVLAVAGLHWPVSRR